MAQRNPALNPPPGATLAPLLARWRALAPREQTGLTLALVVLALLLTWLFAVQPALDTLRRAPAQIDALDVQLQQMRRLAAESRELRAAPPVPPAQAATALQAVSRRLGDRARLSLVGDRATLALTGVRGPELAAWLAEVRSAARARVVDAQLTRGPQGYSGTLVLSLGGTP